MLRLRPDREDADRLAVAAFLSYLRPPRESAACGLMAAGPSGAALDYPTTKEEFDEHFTSVKDHALDEQLELYGNSIRQRLYIPIAEYSEDDSKFYRFVMPQHINKGVQDREYK